MTWQVTRRRWLGGLAACSLGGCLRLRSDDGTAQEDGAAPTTAPDRGTPLSPAAVEIEDAALDTTEAVPGEPVGVTVTVTSSGGPVDDAVLQVLVGDRIAAERLVDVPSGDSETVDAEVTLTSLGAHRVFAVVHGGGSYDRYEFDEPLVVDADAVTLDWSETFVPADRYEESTDQRRLAFGAVALDVLDGGGGDLAAFDVGIDGEEPVFDEGAYRPAEFDHFEEGATGRFLGGPTARTTVVFPDVDIGDAEALDLRGFVPGPLEDLAADVTVNGDPAGTVSFADGPTFRIPLG